MSPLLDDAKLEDDIVQFLVSEAVTVALDTPLREPILDAIERHNMDALDTAKDTAASNESSESSGLLSGVTSTIAESSTAESTTEKPATEVSTGGENDKSATAEDEETTTEDSESTETETDESGRVPNRLQGLTIFLIGALLLYVALRKFSSEE